MKFQMEILNNLDMCTNTYTYSCGNTNIETNIKFTFYFCFSMIQFRHSSVHFPHDYLHPSPKCSFMVSLTGNAVIFLGASISYVNNISISIHYRKKHGAVDFLHHYNIWTSLLTTLALYLIFGDLLSFETPTILNTHSHF